MSWFTKTPKRIQNVITLSFYVAASTAFVLTAAPAIAVAWWIDNFRAKKLPENEEQN